MAKANHTPTVTKPMAVRRGVLLGAFLSLAASKTAPAVPVPPATRERVDAAADTLTASLKDLHGGRWAVTVNHELRFVLIVGGAK